MTKRILLIICILVPLCLQAEVLRLGKSVSDPASEVPELRNIGELIFQGLQGGAYKSFEVITDKKTSINEFIQLAGANRIDISIDSSYAAAQYVEKTDMEPLLVMNRSDSAYVKSYFISRKDSGIRGLKDLSGKTLALADNTTTPFFYLPMKTLKEQGFRTDSSSDKHVSFYITNGKKEVIRDVYLKKADAGAVCATYWEVESEIPEFMRESLRIFHETDSFPSTFLMVRKDVPKETKDKIIEILLELDNSILEKSSIADCRITSFHKIGFNWRSLLKTVDNFSSASR